MVGESGSLDGESWSLASKSFWTSDTLPMGWICDDEITGSLDCFFCDFSTSYKNRLLEHLKLKHPRSKPDFANDTVTEGRTSCHGGPKIRVTHRPSRNRAAGTTESFDEETSTHQMKVPCNSADLFSDNPSESSIEESFATEASSHHNVLTLPPSNIPQDFLPIDHAATLNEAQKTGDGFRLLQPTGFACLLCDFTTEALGKILKHCHSEHKINHAAPPPPIQVDDEIVPKLPRPVHNNSPELHLSEDDDEYDEGTEFQDGTVSILGCNGNSERSTINETSINAVAGQGTQNLASIPVPSNTFTCPHCNKRPLPRHKIRKHICRHYQEHFSSMASKIDKKILVCRHCVRQTLQDRNKRVFATKNPVRFARHLGLAHDLLDKTMIECGSETIKPGILRPRLVINLKRQINWDSSALEATWESSEKAPTISLGDIMAQKMFRSHLPVKRITKKVTNKVISIIKRHKMFSFQGTKITPEMLVRNSVRHRTRTKVLRVQYPEIPPDNVIRDSIRKRPKKKAKGKPRKRATTSKPVRLNHAVATHVVTRTSPRTPTVDSVVYTQAGQVTSPVVCGPGQGLWSPEYLRSETLLTLPNLGPPLYHSTPLRPLPVSAEIACARWRSKRTSESGKPIEINMVVAEPEEATERVIPFEEM